jgi:hypothetical protein
MDNPRFSIGWQEEVVGRHRCGAQQTGRGGEGGQASAFFTLRAYAMRGCRRPLLSDG